MDNETYTLGILAGMGPRSTAPFLERVLSTCEKFYGAKYDMDFPHMIIYSLPTPFHPEKSFEANEMLSCLKTGIESLVGAGANIVAVPCNTVHAYYEEMCRMSSVPVLNIIDETVACLPKKESLVGILATKFTIETGLYQKKLLEQKKNAFWNPAMQQMVDGLILQIKQRGICEETIACWKAIETVLVKNSVSEVIIACTDLFFCSENVNSFLQIYDSSTILAEKLVREYMMHTSLDKNLFLNGDMNEDT